MNAGQKEYTVLILFSDIRELEKGFFEQGTSTQGEIFLILKQIDNFLYFLVPFLL